MPPLIDPPEGWRYGFPKPVPADANAEDFLADLPRWLVRNGYPEELVAMYDAGRTSRVIGDWSGTQG